MATKSESPKEATKPAAQKTATPKTAEVNWLFGKHNALLFYIGLGVLILGFLAMMGGHQKPNEWNENEIYSFRRLTLASFLVIGGFAVIAVAILKRPKE